MRINRTCLILLISLLLAANAGMAQQANPKNIPFEKEFFPEKKKELKDAQKALKMGELHLGAEHEYDQALEEFRLAYAFNPNNAMINHRMGWCILYSHQADRKSALAYLQKADELDPTAHRNNIHFLLGAAYHLNSMWNEAIKEYKEHLRFDPGSPETQKAIMECKYGIELSQKPERVFIDNLGGQINTRYPEYGVVVNADESVLLFTSRREDTQGGEMDGPQFFEDVYSCVRKNGRWTSPVNMGDVINSKRHDATVGISPAGTEMIVYIEGDLYVSDLKGSAWTKPEKLPKQINTKYHETSASFSYDEQSLYFVSDKPDDSFGGYDIYVTHRTPDGGWGEPQNLGQTINTNFDEEGVFMHPDGQTLYFSSNGHATIGGFDIFKSVKNSQGEWGHPVNLGIPINTPSDDVFYVTNARGNRGYYSSVRPEGQGHQDLYVITLLGKEKPMVLNSEDQLLAAIAAPIMEAVPEPTVEIKNSNMTLFKGIVLDSITLKPIGADFTIFDLAKDQEVIASKSNETTGRFLLPLPAGKTYAIEINAVGYLFHSENFEVPEGGNFKEVEKEVLLKPLKAGSKIVLRNVFFDTDKADLRPESRTELKTVAKLLKDNPKLKIEISGHTDNRASAEYNQDLSKRRAEAVVKFLVNQGIKPANLVAAGYGLSQPIATNDSAEGRQQNRRTELKVLED